MRRLTLRTYRVLVVAAASITYFLFYFGRYDYSAAGPFIKSELLWTPVMWGVFTSLLTAGYAVGQLVNGILVDRFGPRKVWGLGGILSGLANLVVGSGRSYTIMTAAWGVNGYAQATGAPSYSRLYSNWFPEGRRGLPAAITNSSRLVAASACLPLLSLVAVAYGWRMCFIIPGLILIPVGVLTLLLLKESPSDVGLEAPWVKHPVSRGFRELITESYKLIWSDKVFLSHALSYGAAQFICFSIYAWIPIYLVEVVGHDPVTAATLTAFFPVAGAICAVPLGYLADKLGFGIRRYILGTGLVGAALSLLILTYVPNLPTLATVLLILACGAGIEGIDTVFFIVIMDKYGKTGRVGTAYGSLNAVGKAFGTIEGLVLGAIIGLLGWREALTTCAAVGLVGALCQIPVTAQWIRK
ncbi:MAG: MFS transporter [Desulfurococcales archaeon]|nr:MFS transporter [Desulfurococcales archaeon]